MTERKERLAGKVALVTGAAQGIGEGIARCFAEHGARVAIADTEGEQGEAVARSLGEVSAFFSLDVREADRWEEVVAAVEDRFGGLDILVNNAGIGWAGRIETQPPDVHRHVIDVNLNGVWLGMRAVVPAMAKRGGGSIVNISSMDGLVGAPGVSSYVASKFAVTGMTRALALEFGSKRIRVNSVHPGVIETPLLRRGGGAALARMQKALDHQPIPRMGTSEEVAYAALYFASDESSYCTGSSLLLDGGHIAGPYREPLDD